MVGVAQFDRHEMLLSSTRAFAEHGFEACSVNRLVDVQATSDAAEVLSAIGHRVVRVRPTEEVRRVSSVFGAIAGAHLARLLSDGEDLDPDVLEPVTAEVVRAGRSMTAVELLRVLTKLHALSYAFADHFSGVDVVLSPTTAQPPPLIGTMSASRHALSSAWSSLRCSCPRCSVMAPTTSDTALSARARISVAA